jgi:hypothetical protein
MTDSTYKLDKTLYDRWASNFSLEEIEAQVKNGEKVYIDSETCGLHSIMVLWQFAIDEGPVYLHNIWRRPVGFTLRLFEMLMELDYVGFNLSFDHFHVAKIYTLWSLLPEGWIPEEHIEEIAMLEKKAQDGPCIKPKRALDLLLISRKGKFQTLMARADVRIRRVPTSLSYALAQELENRVEIDGIYFAKAQDPEAPRWRVYDRKDKDGIIDLQFKDVVLKFKPAGGLKFLAEYAMGLKLGIHFDDVSLPTELVPPDKKLGFVPTALGMAPKGAADKWRIYDKHGHIRGHAWPHVVQKHIDHWAYNEKARAYGYFDVILTRELCHYFDDPEPGDDDSELACMVGAVRWRGFEIDVPGMKKLLRRAQSQMAASPVNINAPPQVRRYIQDAMDDVEGIIIDGTTRKAVLQAITKYSFDESEHGEVCTKCEGAGCARCWGAGTIDAKREVECDSTGALDTGNHPAAIRARELLSIKAAAKEIELYEKLIKAGKFHPDFHVIGTLSTRMSGGSGGLNAQGIKHAEEVRRLFPLKGGHYVLSGGDFDSFEVVLAATVYKDKDLNRALTELVEHENCPHGTECPMCNGTGKTSKGFDCKFCILEDGHPTGKYKCPTCKGKGKYRRKIHALFGTAMYPGKTYEDVMASDGAGFDMYTRGKSGVFGMIYGGDWHTLVKNFGLDEEVAQAAEERFFKMFPGIPKSRERVTKAFQSMHQLGNGRIVWRQPDEYVESFLGFRRYFTLENRITKALVDLAHGPPRHWLTKHFRSIKVVRSMHKGLQSVTGAVMSALYGAAFGMQASNVRAAANHEIQSPGGQITKHVQRKIWDIQPHGVNEFLVAPMNIHDEIMVVNTCPEEVGQVVDDAVVSYRDRIPLIGMTWNIEQENWAEKKGGSRTLAITPPELAQC